MKTITTATWRAALFCALAVLVFSGLAFVEQPEDRHTSDFYSFWAGAQLLGPELYDVSRAEAIQKRVSPLVESKRYIRPPFYALMLWPLGQMPLRAAYIAWQSLNIAAVLAFVWIWRLPAAWTLACALFLPLAWNIGLGQDAPLLLLFLAIGARLIQQKSDFAGGAVLSLCGIKPHLLLFVPVVLLAQRR